MNELIELLQSPVDIKRLVRKLKFSLDDLESSAAQQPSLRLEAGKFRAQIGLKTANSKRRLARVIGKKSLHLRKSGEYKTEGAVKNKLSLDEKVQKLQKEFDTLEVYSEFTKDLIAAYTERSMALSVLNKLRGSEISSHIAAIKGDEEVEHMRKRARHLSKEYSKYNEMET